MLNKANLDIHWPGGMLRAGSNWSHFCLWLTKTECEHECLHADLPPAGCPGGSQQKLGCHIWKLWGCHTASAGTQIEGRGVTCCIHNFQGTDAAPAVIATSNNAILPVTVIGPDGHASWWTVGHVDRRLKRWELSGNMRLFNLYQNRKIPPKGGRSLWRICGVLGTFLVRNGDVSGKGGSVWELDAMARKGNEMRKTSENKGKTLWTIS